MTAEVEAVIDKATEELLRINREVSTVQILTN